MQTKLFESEYIFPEPVASDPRVALSLYSNTQFADLVHQLSDPVLVKTMYMGADSTTNSLLLDYLVDIRKRGGVASLSVDMSEGCLPFLNRFVGSSFSLEDNSRLKSDGVLLENPRIPGYTNRNHTRFIVSGYSAYMHAMWMAEGYYNSPHLEPIYKIDDPEIVEMMKVIYYTDRNLDVLSKLGNRLIYDKSGVYMLNQAKLFLKNRLRAGDKIVVSSSWYPDFLVKDLSMLPTDCTSEVYINYPFQDFSAFEIPFMLTKSASLATTGMYRPSSLNYFIDYHGKFILVQHCDGSESDIFLTTSNFTNWGRGTAEIALVTKSSPIATSLLQQVRSKVI